MWIKTLLLSIALALGMVSLPASADDGVRMVVRGNHGLHAGCSCPWRDALRSLERPRPVYRVLSEDAAQQIPLTVAGGTSVVVLGDVDRDGDLDGATNADIPHSR